MRQLARVCSGVVAAAMVLSAVQGLRLLSIPTVLLSVLGAWAFATNLRNGVGRNQRYTAAAVQVLAVLLPIAAVVLADVLAGDGSRGDMAGLGVVIAVTNAIVAGIATIEGVRLARGK